MAITKPPVLPSWADAGDKVQPSNAEIQVGWPLSSIPPSRQRFNWLLNFLANGIRYFSRRGLPDYDAAETYMIGDRIIGDDGKTYRSLIDNNIGQTPSAQPTKWERWGWTKSELNNHLNAGLAAGTADAITSSYTPAITALTNGMVVYVRAAAANATTTPTFTPNSGTVAAKTIVKGSGAALAAGDISSDGHWLELKYDSSLDKWVLLNPATGLNLMGNGYMLVEHQTAQGVDAGDTVVGVNTRPLNTVMANTISGASLASDQITLPAGTYRIRASAVAWHCNGSRLGLYNVTDSAYTALGMAVNGENSLADLMGWEISLKARFTISASKTFQVRQFSEFASTNGFGKASNAIGVEVYASVEINKE